MGRAPHIYTPSVGDLAIFLIIGAQVAYKMFGGTGAKEWGWDWLRGLNLRIVWYVI